MKPFSWYHALGPGVTSASHLVMLAILAGAAALIAPLAAWRRKRAHGRT